MQKYSYHNMASIIVIDIMRSHAIMVHPTFQPGTKERGTTSVGRASGLNWRTWLQWGCSKDRQKACLLSPDFRLSSKFWASRFWGGRIQRDEMKKRGLESSDARQTLSFFHVAPALHPSERCGGLHSIYSYCIALASP